MRLSDLAFECVFWTFILLALVYELALPSLVGK